ncbi:MAG: hypothetical protein ACE10D_01015, partial [Planctomycetota bacterium]
APLRLANLVVINRTTGAVQQTLNLAWDLPMPFVTSTGVQENRLVQSLPVMAAFVPDPNVPLHGKVYVALSNGAGTSAGLSLFHPGTVQVWRADFTRAQPLSPELGGRDPRHVTRTHVSDFYNPVALTHYAARNGLNYLILTDAGASLFGADSILRPTTDAQLEFVDLDTEQFRDSWAVGLGQILPSVHLLALGRDAANTSYGLLTSQTFAAVHVVELSGLQSNPVTAGRLGLLRTVDLVPGGSSTAGSGFQTDLILRPSGAFAVVSSFTTSSLQILALPANITVGPFTSNPAPFDTLPLGTTRGFGLGALASMSGPGPELYAVVNGHFSPLRNSFLGSFDAGGQLP